MAVMALGAILPALASPYMRSGRKAHAPSVPEQPEQVMATATEK